MSTSVIPDALDALVTILTAALPDTRVVDGPPLDLRGRDLLVGWQEGNEPTDWTQTVGPLATTRPRDEDFDIPCLLWHATGNDDTSAARTTLFADFALVENALRTTPGLGLASSLSVRTELTRGAYRQRRADHLESTLAFTVNVKARI